MRLINTKTMEMHEFLFDEVVKKRSTKEATTHMYGIDLPYEKATPYAILSHRWGSEEITFKDYQKGRGRELAGYRKVHEFCEIALESYGLEWAWADTCCIDKRSSAELSEAINSMFDYYCQAEVCITHLADVSMDVSAHSVGACQKSESGLLNYCEACTKILKSFEQSAWFTRGWTLQELLAPDALDFFSNEWHKIGGLGWRSSQYACVDWLEEVEAVTGIPRDFLQSPIQERRRSRTLYAASIAERMRWAAKRTTSRVEDMSYSLLGIMRVNMPLLYGEGKRGAWRRLQEEIVRSSNDETIFMHSLWKSVETWADAPILAQDITAFGLSSWLSVTHGVVSRPSSYTIGNQGLELRLAAGTAFWHKERQILSVPLNCIYADSSNDRNPCLLVLEQNRCGHFTRVHIFKSFDINEFATDFMYGPGIPCEDETVCVHATQAAMHECEPSYQTR